MEAIFALAAGWLDIVALEEMLGFYDHETFTGSSDEPAAPYQLLRSVSAPNVRVTPSYRSVETRLDLIDVETTAGWLDQLLVAATVDKVRLEPRVQELIVAGLRAKLPVPTADERLQIDCYAGEGNVAIDGGWVTVPADPPDVPNPVSLWLTNTDGSLRITLEVFWSPWADAPAIQQGLSRLQARGWRVDR